MQTVPVQIPGKEEYLIEIGSEGLSRLEVLVDKERYEKVFIFTETTVEQLWIDELSGRLATAPRFVFPSGETAKSVSSATRGWEFLLNHSADRHSLVINIGGGMLTDLGGFVASTFMRGVDFWNVPTTLLAQVDASVGGKTGVNLLGTKNIVGTFTQPKKVFIDSCFLKTLPEREFRSGIAEILKHGLIRDREYFARSVAYFSQGERQEERLEEIIARSCEIKRDTVVQDETEGGIRKILNFGHTFGHAFEALSHQGESPLLHGEAISLGMLGEVYLADELGLLASGVCEEVREALIAVGLPVSLPEHYEFAAIEELLMRDKKNEGGEVRWSLMTEVGECLPNQRSDAKSVQRAYDRLLAA
jgi:3-dehydroquinate synthase